MLAASHMFSRPQWSIGEQKPGHKWQLEYEPVKLWQGTPRSQHESSAPMSCYSSRGETGKYFTPESMSKADQNPELTKDAKAAVGETLGNLELLM